MIDQVEFPKRKEFLEYKSTNYTNRSVEDQERFARQNQLSNPLALLILGFYSAFKVMFLYLINLATILSCLLTAGLTYYWYDYGQKHQDWTGSTLDFVLVSGILFIKYYLLNSYTIYD